MTLQSLDTDLQSILGSVVLSYRTCICGVFKPTWLNLDTDLESTVEGVVYAVSVVLVVALNPPGRTLIRTLSPSQKSMFKLQMWCLWSL